MVELVYTRPSKRRPCGDESSNLSLATFCNSEVGGRNWEEHETSDLRPPNSNLFLADELGSQLAFIRPIRSVQFRSLQLETLHEHCFTLGCLAEHN